MDKRLERANRRYEEAAFGGDERGLTAASRDLDGVEADLAMARGRVLHGRFLSAGGRSAARRATGDAAAELALFERAAELYRSLGDVRGEGEALLWIGIYHQVVRHDQAAATPALARAGDLARRAGDRLTLSYVLRHQGIAEHQAGRLDAARAHLEESTRLRRELGFRPGLAANLVGLAYLAAARRRPDEARAHLAEATSLARAAGARAVLAQIEEARTALDLPER